MAERLGKKAMEQATAVYQPPQAEEKPQHSELHLKTVQRLWQRMLEIYGSQWEKDCGHIDGDVFPIWCDGLAEFTPQVIGRGLRAVLDDNSSDWPPNLVKFRRFCRESLRDPSHKPFKPSLPKPKQRFSVMRIEQAKAIALSGRVFKLAKPGADMVMDWTPDDEKQLLELISQFEPEPANGRTPEIHGRDEERRLNKLIDHVEFSHGTHYGNLHRRD